MKKTTSRHFRIALVTALLIAMLLPTMASAYTAYVNTTTQGLNVRQGPGVGYSIIRSFPRGTAVQVMSVSGGWAYVNVNGVVGYMSEQYLSTTNPLGAASAASKAPATGAVINGIPYTNQNGQWWPLYPNGVPVGSYPNPYGPASGFHYPWEELDPAFYEYWKTYSEEYLYR